MALMRKIEIAGVVALTLFGAAGLGVHYAAEHARANQPLALASFLEADTRAAEVAAQATNMQRRAEQEAKARAAAEQEAAKKRDIDVARQAALRDVSELGMIGLLNSGAGGDPDSPTAPWGRDDSLGSDPLSARGSMWGDSIGESFGAGGLGLSGIGKGGGGEGVGLGGVGTIGTGSGVGKGGGGRGYGTGAGRLAGTGGKSRPAKLRASFRVSIDGDLDVKEVKKLLRTKRTKFRACYAAARRANPSLEGGVSLRFDVTAGGVVVIDKRDDAIVSTVSKPAADCLLDLLSDLTFPNASGKKATITVRFTLRGPKRG